MREDEVLAHAAIVYATLLGMPKNRADELRPAAPAAGCLGVRMLVARRDVTARS
jgi:hypothetical protein